MVQIGLGRSKQMTLAAHAEGYGCDWSQIDRGGTTGQQPVVYVAAGSHAAYPHAGETGLEATAVDRHRGNDGWLNLTIELVNGNDRWPTWRGRWGASVDTTWPGWDFRSPVNPSEQGKWTRPSTFHANASDC